MKVTFLIGPIMRLKKVQIIFDAAENVSEFIKKRMAGESVAHPLIRFGAPLA